VRRAAVPTLFIKSADFVEVRIRIDAGNEAAHARGCRRSADLRWSRARASTGYTLDFRLIMHWTILRLEAPEYR
jgi:hypothetical protein